MNTRINDRFQTAAEFQDALLNGEQKYTSSISKGNEYYLSGNYHDALTHFEVACELINTNDDLNGKINRCKLLITEEKEQERAERRFQSLRAQTNELFDKKEYEQALSGYKQLLTLRPGDSYYSGQIRICKEKIEKQLCYNQAIEQGNEKLKKEYYEEAILNYQKALQYIENDAYSTKQLQICKEKLYNQAIKQGDTQFKKKDYNNALFYYKQALQYKENDSIVLSKITECKEILDGTKLLPTNEVKPPKNEPVQDLTENAEKKTSKKILRLILFFIIGVVAMVVILFTIGLLSDANTEQKAEKLNSLRIDASIAFDQKEWNKAYRLYIDIMQLDPDDDTGYDNFLHIGILLMESVGACDGNVKDLLTKAKFLKNTSEVNDLLKKCN